MAVQVYAGFLNQGWHELPLVRCLERGGAGGCVAAQSGDEGEEIEVLEMLSLYAGGEV